MLKLTLILDLHKITEDFCLIKQDIYVGSAAYICTQNDTDLVQIQSQEKHTP